MYTASLVQVIDLDFEDILILISVIHPPILTWTWTWTDLDRSLFVKFTDPSTACAALKVKTAGKEESRKKVLGSKSTDTQTRSCVKRILEKVIEVDFL